MVDFSVGQKVICIKNSLYGGYKRGIVYTVKEYHPTELEYICTLENSLWIQQRYFEKTSDCKSVCCVNGKKRDCPFFERSDTS